MLFCLLLIIFCFSLLAAESGGVSKDTYPKVRVLVAENVSSIKLTAKGSYVIRSLPSLQIIQTGGRLREAVIAASPRGIKFGELEWAVKGFRLESSAERGLFLDKTRFRGALDVLKNPNGTLSVVNLIEIEDYLYGVLHHEVSPWWPMEALKAQAIAARTYALYQAGVSRAQPFDLRNTTSSQVYGGSTTERYRAKRAVDLTVGKVLAYGGKLFPAYFHATCAGKTAASSELWKISLPPLSGGAACTYCRFSPHFSWQARVPLADIEDKMKQNGRYVGQILKIEPLSQTPSGRVGSLRITGTNGEMVIAAKDFRIWVGGNKIRSTSFTVGVREDAAQFEGKGWGHGVGLCQWGAFGQSLMGHSSEKILQFYYPGSNLVSAREAK